MLQKAMNNPCLLYSLLLGNFSLIFLASSKFSLAKSKECLTSANGSLFCILSIAKL